MVTNINLPDSWLPWIEKKRYELGLRSRQALILEAIKTLVKVPQEVKPEDMWPTVERKMRCPDCFPSSGVIVEHCHGRHYAEVLKDSTTKQLIRYVCICACAERESGEVKQ